MSKSAYPISTDLTDFLSDAGLTTTGLDVATAVEAGILSFEREVGRKMLAIASTVRTFDPPTHVKGWRSILDLGGDLAPGVAPTVTVDGVAKTAGTDYRFLPQNASDEGRPYNRMEFVSLFNYPLTWNSNGDVSITGRWAYGTTLPEDVWRAMLAGAGLDLLPQISYALSKGLVSWTEAGVTENYGQTPLQGLQAGWQYTFTSVVNRYRRVTVGL